MEQEISKKNKLYNLAESFRKGIENIKEIKLPSYLDHFNDFPNGCCEDTCKLLVRYYSDHELKVFKVKGIKIINKKKISHTWIEYGDYIIDITADQFSEKKKKVIVTKNKKWNIRGH
jgi:hypothetical protein